MREAIKTRGRKPEPPSLLGHHETLSPKQTDEVADAVAELIVSYVQKQGRIR